MAPNDEQVAVTEPEPPACDPWELDQQLQHIQQVLGTEKPNSGRTAAAYQQEAARLDPSHAGPAAWHPLPSAKSARAAKRKSTRSHSTMAGLVWIALSLGTMAFVCGGILLGWSIYTDRSELWDVGMPIALCGQIALLIGLVLQLDRLWHDSRQAADKLDDVDEQLHELKATTTMLGTTRGPSAGAFYSHLADGAGPELLLSDLKGQLDLLAVKLMQHDG
ncbi:MAG: hypothetical protein V3R99_13405 [Thermoguttaceae bacterium]